jgi:hypothetical protein
VGSRSVDHVELASRLVHQELRNTKHVFDQHIPLPLCAFNCT